MPIVLVILLVILTAIAFRRVISIVIPIWAIMAIGAFAALLFQQITLKQALLAIEPEVMLYLLGFPIAQAAETSSC